MSASPVVHHAPSPAGAPRTPRAGRRNSWFLPSLADILLVVFVGILFMRDSGWLRLLTDGDTGWHIRTGEYILKNHAVPVSDLFSFTTPGGRWYAWEWLSDVIFALVHMAGGLKGVALFSGALITLTMILLFRHMIWRGASVHVAVLLSIFVTDTLRLHYLARPHLFTTLFAVIALWMIDRDWKEPGRGVWLLVPLTVVWTNLHGGFLVLLTAAGASAVCALLRRERVRARRYVALTAACFAATFVNPYGWQLHRHIWEYLNAGWLIRNIDEFRSPFSRPGEFPQFEALLMVGLICTWELLRRRRYHEALLLVFWAHSALTAARHITIYALVAAPVLADSLSSLWRTWVRGSDRGSIRGALRELVEDLQPAAGWTSVWGPALFVFFACGSWGIEWPRDFAPNFPTAMVGRQAAALNGPGREGARILAQDIWGGYLDYRFYPNRHVFIDGRSDYYGYRILQDYVAARAAGERWGELAARYGWDFVLIPPEWPLAKALEKDSAWQLRDRDKVALLFERRR